MIIVSGVALVYDEAFAARVGGEPYEGGAEIPEAPTMRRSNFMFL